MSTFITARTAGPRAKVALLMLTGALGSAAAMAASAATLDSDVQTLAVRYSNQALATDSGVRALYRKLIVAADRVCPLENNRWMSNAVLACRRQAVARAVQQINNPRLAELQATGSKSG